MSNRPPNILIVMLDTARGDIVDSLPLTGANLGALVDFRKQCLLSSEAYSPSTWTYPSHASLFTGLYPWENSSLSTEFAPLRSDYPHLAGILGSLGYRTISLSANPLVSPWTGLAAPFQTAFWSHWWHLFLRVPPLTSPVGNGHAKLVAPPPRRALPSNLFTLVKRSLLRHPAVASQLSRVAGNVLDTEDDLRDEVDPWIEHAFSSWLRQQSPETPVFAFINLMEAHEPYVPSSRAGREKALRICRQDREEFLAESWIPTAKQLADLRALYTHSLEVALRRVSAILTVLKEHNRWENSVIVLTGDHGQEFGELDGLFHGTFPGDPQVRVPLWLRVPGRNFEGRPARGMTSLVDVFPTILGLVDAANSLKSSGRDILSLMDEDREKPILSISEQLPDDNGFRMKRGSQWVGLNRFWVATRQRSESMVVDLHRRIGYRGSQSNGAYGRPELVTDVDYVASRPEVDIVEAEIRTALEARVLGDTDQRLRSWGYF